jgi:hypothetical protein
LRDAANKIVRDTQRVRERSGGDSALGGVAELDEVVRALIVDGYVGPENAIACIMQP